MTLYIAINNPVTDCGCFGEALKISNWETFFKNVVLMLLIVAVWVSHKKFRPVFLSKIEWVFMFVFVITGVGLSVYSVRHLPMIDFLPYKVGVNIPESMKVPQGKPTDKYDTKLIYEKYGVKKNLPLKIIQKTLLGSL
ncbi:MAG: hypothetical protein QM751_08255 [Paludibacteraceae bacterium]